ncbi:hypothetical protein ACHAPT_004263 [Fusarium lateritium]
MSAPEPKPHYLPLDTSRQEIRLLEIISVAPEIVCKFQTVSLLDNPSFCTLSYVWGDETDTQDITVNNAPCSITSSLANALEYAAFHWKAIFPDRDVGTRRLWADALCINQADNKEKGEQVQLMKEVYSMAEIVFCALDAKAPDNEMQLAFHAIKSIATGADEDGFDPVVLDSLLNPKPRRPKMRRVTECLTFTCQLYRHLGVTVGSAIEVFCGLRYWKRAWIFQEVVLARRPVFIYRTLLAELETLLRAHSWCTAAQEQPPPEGTDQAVCDAIEEFDPGSLWSINSARITIGAGKTWEDEKTRNEFQIARRSFVSTGGLLEARDPKDHVYALIGVANLKLKPDYSPDKSLESVHIDLCTELIDIPSDFSFEFLFFLNQASLVMQDELEPSYDFPSWVPNLPRRWPSRSDAIPPRPFERLWQLSLEMRQWMGCGSSDEVFIRDKSLFVRGVFVSTILEQGPVITFYKDTWLSFVTSVFEMLNSYPLETRHPHPLVTLTKALGADCRERDVWESAEVLRVIRLLQYFLINGEPPEETDDSTEEIEYTEPFGEEFLSNIGLGLSWRGSVLEEPLTLVHYYELIDQDGQEEQDILQRSPISDFLDRISDKMRYEEEIAQTEMDAEKTFLDKSRLARAPDGGMMFVPWSAAEGDQVVLLRGLVTFSFVRKVDDYYLNVGRC